MMKVNSLAPGDSWRQALPENPGDWQEVAIHLAQCCGRLNVMGAPRHWRNLRNLDLLPLGGHNRVYILGIKGKWHIDTLIEIVKLLSPRMHGASPSIDLIWDHPEWQKLLLTHILLIEPRILTSCVIRFGWDWLLANVPAEIFAQMKNGPSARSFSEQLGRLLSSTVVLDPASPLVNRLKELLNHAGLPTLFWFQAQLNDSFLNLSDLRHGLPEPSLVAALCKASPLLKTKATQLARRLFRELRQVSLSPLDNQTVRLALAWLPAAEVDDVRLSSWLQFLEISYNDMDSLASFNPKDSALIPAVNRDILRRQVQLLPDILYYILDYRPTLGGDLPDIIAKFKVQISPLNERSRGTKRKGDEEKFVSE